LTETVNNKTRDPLLWKLKGVIMNYVSASPSLLTFSKILFKLKNFPDVKGGGNLHRSDINTTS
jgi:hypothetical protein